MALRFLSLNIWTGGRLWDPLLDFLKTQDADIVALQEVYHTQNPELTENQHRAFTLLSDELDYPYAHFAPAFAETKIGYQIDQGAAIFSKFPLEPLPTVFYDIPYGERVSHHDFTQTPRSLQHVRIEIPNGDQGVEPTSLHVLNTQGIWGRDGVDNDRRLAMARTILEELDTVPPNTPAIIAGDFNVRPDTKTIAMLEERLTNVFKDQLKTSFNMRQKTNPGYADAVVDMLFTTPGVHVIEASCPNVNISDHLPLVATLSI